MNNFPELNIPESKKDDQWCKMWLDAIDDYYRGSENSQRIRRIEKMYNSHNGKLMSETIINSQAKLGKDLAISTNLKDYHIGRTKISALIGEWLDSNFTVNVFTTNRDAINRKLASFKRIYGTIAAKKELVNVQKEMGWPLIKENSIPNISEDATTEEIKTLAAYLNPKSMNEIIMQAILNDKIKRQNIKILMIDCLRDAIFTGELHGKIEKDKDGKDIFIPISAANRIFQESTGDYNLERSPFQGEYRPMFEHEILSMFDLNDDEKLRLRSENVYTEQMSINAFRMIPVIFGEIKTTMPVVRKRFTKKDGTYHYKNIDSKEYELKKADIARDVRNKKYEIEIQYKEDLWQGVKIGQSIYKNMQRKPYQIQVKGDGKYHRAYSDYISIVFGTVKGVRIPIQEIIDTLSEVYNFTMWQILREIKKNKGKVFVYDEAALPAEAKSIKNMLYHLEENSVIRINSADDGNISNKTIDQATQLIVALDLGLSQSFPQLIATKQELERTIDRLTGISEQREGFGKATETATATNMRMSGSRAVTGELFYMFQQFINYSLFKLAEKTKLNEEYIEGEGALLLSDDQKQFLEKSKSLSFDEYGTFISDGRKESYVREMLRQYFPAEVNASMLRSLDIAEFELTENISEALAVLKRAYETITKINNESNQSKERIAAQKNEAALQLSKEDREDRQEHETELLKLKILGDLQKLQNKEVHSQIKNLDNIQSSERIEANKSNN